MATDFKTGLLGAMQDPMFQMGMGLLARPNQNFGRAFGGAARDMSLSQMALQQARDQSLQTQQQNAQKQREQEWIQQNMPGMAGAPGWMQQAAGKAQFSQPKVNPKMVMGPGGKPIWANAPDAIGQQAYSKPLVQMYMGPKLSTNNQWIDPADPSKGATFIPGTPADPKMSAAYRTEEGMLSQVEESAKTYETMLGKTGPEIVPGQEKSSLKSAYTDLLLELKELYNLGVLSGPDMELMESVLTDPTSITANTKGLYDRAAEAVTGEKKDTLGTQFDVVKKKLSSARQRLNNRYGIKQKGGGLSNAEMVELQRLRKEQGR